MISEKKSRYDFKDVPLGFGMALMANVGAFQRFSALTAEEQKSVIEGAQGMSSKDEMRAYIENFGRQDVQ